MIARPPPGALSIAGIHYRVREDELQVLHVYHTARMPPDVSGA